MPRVTVSLRSGRCDALQRCVSLQLGRQPHAFVEGEVPPYVVGLGVASTAGDGSGRTDGGNDDLASVHGAGVGVGGAGIGQLASASVGKSFPDPNASNDPNLSSSDDWDHDPSNALDCLDVVTVFGPMPVPSGGSGGGGVTAADVSCEFGGLVHTRRFIWSHASLDQSTVELRPATPERFSRLLSSWSAAPACLPDVHVLSVWKATQSQRVGLELEEDSLGIVSTECEDSVGDADSDVLLIFVLFTPVHRCSSEERLARG